MADLIYPISKVSVYIQAQVWDIRNLSKPQLIKLRDILLNTNYSIDDKNALTRQYNVLESLGKNDSQTSFLRVENAILNFVGQWYMNTAPRGNMPTTSKVKHAKQNLTTATFNVGQLPIRNQMDESVTEQILAQMEQLQNDLQQCQNKT